MARKSTTNSAVGIADEAQVSSAIIITEKNMNDIVKEEKEENAEPLKDSDEIKVVSIVPNVSYKDSHTGDFFEWKKVGHIEPMTFETLKNMWRGYKAYFREMQLRPLDNRVIKKFGLESTLKKYDFLMCESNYTRENIDKLCEVISDTPNGTKFTVCSKIKSLIVSGKITDIKVIKALEKHFNTDLTSFLN